MICICEFQEDFLRDSLSVPLFIGARQLDRVECATVHGRV